MRKQITVTWLKGCLLYRVCFNPPCLLYLTMFALSYYVRFTLPCLISATEERIFTGWISFFPASFFLRAISFIQLHPQLLALIRCPSGPTFYTPCFRLILIWLVRLTKPSPKTEMLGAVFMILLYESTSEGFSTRAVRIKNLARKKQICRPS